MNRSDPSEFGVIGLSYSWLEQENVVCVFGVGRGMPFVLLNMPHNFVWELHEEAN